MSDDVVARVDALVAAWMADSFHGAMPSVLQHPALMQVAFNFVLSLLAIPRALDFLELCAGSGVATQAVLRLELLAVAYDRLYRPATTTTTTTSTARTTTSTTTTTTTATTTTTTTTTRTARTTTRTPATATSTTTAATTWTTTTTPATTTQQQSQARL